MRNTRTVSHKLRKTLFFLSDDDNCPQRMGDLFVWEYVLTVH
jgi:hypothetical protein